MNNNITVDKLFLQKFAEFTKVVLSEIKSLRSQLSEQMNKTAEHDEQMASYHDSVAKIAEALYNSDFDFIIGSDRKKFIKKAADNPELLATAFQKVCEASDVTLIGRPARVAAKKKIASYDPVYAKAFGLGTNNESIIDLD